MPDPRNHNDRNATTPGEDTQLDDSEPTVFNLRAPGHSGPSKAKPIDKTPSIMAKPIHAKVDPDATVFGEDLSILAEPIHAPADPDATVYGEDLSILAEPIHAPSDPDATFFGEDPSILAEPIHAPVDPDVTVFGEDPSILAEPIHAPVDPDVTVFGEDPSILAEPIRISTDPDATAFSGPASILAEPIHVRVDPDSTVVVSDPSIHARPIHAPIDPDATAFVADPSIAAQPIHARHDPDATTLGDPSSLRADPIHAPADPDSTAFDPYATRTDASTESGGSTGLQGTIAWDGAGPDPGTTTGYRGSRFNPLRLHARGGLGEVYVAIDGELNREVALKEIQEKHGGHADSQFRFIFEAEITGGLEHPGIVPVYGLGRYADGRPYYAMRFIRGDSFKAAIEKFHKSDEAKAAVSFRHSLRFHQLLARFVAVCHAIDYAHTRGVIHRDIKPDNVMLGGHGETLVVDWGLAKALNRPDPPDESHPRPLRPQSGSDTSATMMGSVMGTPSFMSPEQAAGELDKLGPASDIFSLGSTLYALLTSKAPFREMPIAQLLEKVKKAEFPSPRTTHKAVPPALEAICLKAMALRPADRYPTAAALAADVERWLADEPVEAYPEPWTIRLGRWARRHRTAVAATFVLLATGSTALGVSNVLIAREKARTEHNYTIARDAVEKMLTRVGEVDLADVPQLEGVRRDLLDRALAFYRDFLLERGQDPTARRETGRAMARLGDIREQLGQYGQAEKNYREALALLDQAKPDLDTRRALARTRVNLGILLKKSNRYAESEKFLRTGLDDRKGLAADHPDDTDDARGLALARYQLGTLLARLKDRSKEDEALYLEAVADQEALTNKPTATIDDRRELARFLNNLAMLQAATRQADAEKTFRRAVAIQDEIEPRSASSAGFRWQRARTWNNLAIICFNSRRLDEAKGLFLKARQAFEALEADFPLVPEYHRERAITLNNLGQLLAYFPLEQVKPLDLFDQALAEQRSLVADFAEVPDHKLKLGLTCLSLGEFLLPTDKARAEASYRESVALTEKLATDFPDAPEYQASYGRCLVGLAAFVGQQDKPADAIPIFESAIATLEKARSSNPREPNYIRYLSDAYIRLGSIHKTLGRPADIALAAERVTKLAPDSPDAWLNAARLYAAAFDQAGSDANLKETYANAVFQAIRNAIDRKATDPGILDAIDFKSLKGRPEFEKLREEWLAKGRKVNV